MTETALYTATICKTCGGSGELDAAVITRTEDDDDAFDPVETESCDNCAGSGWEPPEWKDDGSEDDAEGSGFVEPLDSSV